MRVVLRRVPGRLAQFLLLLSLFQLRVIQSQKWSHQALLVPHLGILTSNQPLQKPLLALIPLVLHQLTLCLWKQVQMPLPVPALLVPHLGFLESNQPQRDQVQKTPLALVPLVPHQLTLRLWKQVQIPLPVPALLVPHLGILMSNQPQRDQVQKTPLALATLVHLLKSQMPDQLTLHLWV